MTRPTTTGASQDPARAATTSLSIAVNLAVSLAVSLAGTVAAGLAACQDQAPVPRLYTVTPQKLHSDRRQRLRLVGSELVPSYDLDLGNGSRHADPSRFSGFVGSGPGSVALRDFAVLGAGILEATLDPGLGAGSHDVVVIDPRGARAVLAGGFVSLGLDTAPPALVLVAPAAPAELAPGTPVAARALIEDDGNVRDFAWQALGPRGPVQRGSCTGGPALGSGRVICDFAFVVPAALLPGDMFQLAVTATDDAPTPNRATLARSFLLQARPRLTGVSPALGGAAGGTDVVVRGVGLRPGTRVWFGDAALDPDGGLLLDENTIVGKTPPHAPGVTVVRLFTPLGESPADSTFEYLAAPTLTAIDPTRGSDRGGAAVVIHGQHFTGATQVYFGASLASAAPLQQPRFVAPTEIRGLARAGVGSAAVFAVDPSAGWAQLADAFTWDPSP